MTEELDAVSENGGKTEVASVSLRSAGNMLAVLSCFSVQHPSWTLTELSREVGLGKSTIFRILATLEANQFLTRDGDGLYRPTMRMWEIGAAALVVNGLHEASRRFLPRLSERTGETAYCTILDGHDVVHVDVYVTRNPIRLHAEIGDRFPAHAVASGKVLLAALPEEAIDTYIRGGLPAYTDRTLTDPVAFRDEMRLVRRQGFAVNRGERQTYVVGAAAPVHDHTGSVVAAIAAAGPSIRITDDLMAVGRVVREVADEMSFSLGCPPAVLEAELT
ncbi:MAG: IclR family transcriptional regulator [Thermomicrobiales bacterium]|nr:IclR family transcriptional regulator [Thermomicrobiales bacterium]